MTEGVENRRRPLLRRIATALRRAVGRVDPVVAAVTCIGVLLGYLVGVYVTGPFHEASRWMGAMLACTSVVVVLQMPGYRESVRLGLLYVAGTFIGAAIAYLYLLAWPVTIVGLLATVFVLEAVCMFLHIYNDGRIATITLIVILLISQTSTSITPAVNCLLRFLESAVGVAIGVGLVRLLEAWQKRRVRQRARERRAA